MLAAVLCARLTPLQAVEVDRDDQASINEFGRLNNRLHELDAELEGKKARTQEQPRALPTSAQRCGRGVRKRLLCSGLASPAAFQKLLADLEDASNELLITDDTEARRCPPGQPCLESC